MTNRREDFYIDLMSNSSLTYYPENTLSSFKVLLPKPVTIEGAYEVALKQIIFPSSLEDPVKGKIYISSPISTDEESRETIDIIDVPLYKSEYSNKNTGRKKNDSIPFNVKKFKTRKGPRNWRTVIMEINNDDNNIPSMNSDEFLSYITKKLFQESGKKMLEKRILKANPILPRKKPGDMPGSSINWKLPVIFRLNKGNTLEIILRDDDLSIALDADFSRMLGFNLNEREYLEFKGSGIYRFPNIRPTIRIRRPSFFNVYTDIITPVIFSDIMSPNLRTVTIPSESGIMSDQSVSTNFTLLDYHKVSLRNFQTIEIQLRDGSGSFIPFNYGLVYLRLHFRPRGM